MTMETSAYRAAAMDLPEDVYLKVKTKHLRPWTCPQCERDGLRFIGQCPNCLKARAHNIEWLETHTFVLSHRVCSYHGSSDTKKSLPLRLPDEHPTMFYGIEWENEFDQDCIDIFDYDYDDDDEEDRGSDRISDLIEAINNATGGLCVFERDGSLSNGIELIFRPMSYRYLTHPDTVKKLRKVAEILSDYGAYNEPRGAGIHIHASTAFFRRAREGYTIRETAYEDFDWVFNVFQPQMEMLGGRKFTDYCQSRLDIAKNRFGGDSGMNIYGTKIALDLNIKACKGEGMPDGADHHVAVNLRQNTLETRIFQSTLDVDKILSYVEIIRNLAHAVRDNTLEGRTLNDILHTKENKFLDAYIEKCKKQAFKTKYDFDLDEVFTSSLELDADFNKIKAEKQKEKQKCVL